MKLPDTTIPLAGPEFRTGLTTPEAQQVQIVIPGAVSVGLKCVDGVVLGNERRVIWGYTVTSKKVKKVFRVTDTIGFSVSGLISDMQMLVKIMRANANLYELNNHTTMSVKSLTKLLSGFLYQRKMAPLYTQVIVGGVDKDGPAIYTLDPVGSLIPDDFAATGSSTTLAISILEAEYDETMTVEQGKELAEKAIVNSIKRDATTGEMMDLLIIKADGSQGMSKDLSEII
ncbi:proteasome subunit beta [Candidatus Bathyarchaeota archaeon]|nr:proteasome subunit beta [Candidatus Bathyarchaeota archaeon]